MPLLKSAAKYKTFFEIWNHYVHVANKLIIFAVH